ncbi:MAG: biotin/lipoate A/B protein ligase family protein [Haloarculaceae archaeon]
MDRADGEWRLIREESRTGPTNMALDEVAAETAADGGPRTVRVYRWEPSTLSLGYHQDPGTIDWAFCERAGITVTRRPTGGGAIYHDSRGDVSYSVVAPADELPGDLMDSYELLCEPLFDALDALGLDAGFADEERPAVYRPACYLRELNPAHDVVAGDGRKLSGNAQYRQRDAVIQHGSITFARGTERHLACFADPGTTPAEFDDRVASVRDRVGASREETVAALEEALADWAGAEAGAWTDAELDRARGLAERKYGTEAWTRRGEDPTG